MARPKLSTGARKGVQWAMGLLIVLFFILAFKSDLFTFGGSRRRGAPTINLAEMQARMNAESTQPASRTEEEKLASDDVPFQREFAAELKRSIPGLNSASVVALFENFESKRTKHVRHPIPGGPPSYLTQLGFAETEEVAAMQVQIFGMTDTSVYSIEANVRSSNEKKCRASASLLFDTVCRMEFDGCEMALSRSWVEENIDAGNVTATFGKIRYELSSTGSSRVLTITAPMPNPE